jgi:hypothetical protein
LLYLLLRNIILMVCPNIFIFHRSSNGNFRIIRCSCDGYIAWCGNRVCVFACVSISIKFVTSFCWLFHFLFYRLWIDDCYEFAWIGFLLCDFVFLIYRSCLYSLPMKQINLL